VRFVDSGDAYWVSHLLLNGWLAGLAERVGGRPVAFAPDQSSLTVMADEPEALAQVYELVAQEFAEAPRGLTPAAYTVDDTGLVVPYEAPDDHLLHRVVRRSERILAGHEYAAQATLLQESGVAEQVADCGVYTHADGSAFTAATWRVGSPTLLPEVDLVRLVTGLGAGFTVPWAALAEVDAVAEAPEYRPTRYRTPACPPPNALGYLRERSAQR
jgi:hypothetical protein